MFSKHILKHKQIFLPVAGETVDTHNTTLLPANASKTQQYILIRPHDINV